MFRPPPPLPKKEISYEKLITIFFPLSHYPPCSPIRCHSPPSPTSPLNKFPSRLFSSSCNRAIDKYRSLFVVNSSPQLLSHLSSRASSALLSFRVNENWRLLRLRTLYSTYLCANPSPGIPCRFKGFCNCMLAASRLAPANLRSSCCTTSSCDPHHRWRPPSTLPRR